MSEKELLKQLEAYFDPHMDFLEASHVLKTIDFIRRTPEAFMRENSVLGHVGASAVVVDNSRQYILLSKHSILNSWSFFGSHCDGETNTPTVALKRISKNISAEFAQCCFVQEDIFDVDVHYVPAHQSKTGVVEAHLHYDIAHLAIAPYDPSLIDQSNEWFSLEEALSLPTNDTQHTRILEKIKNAKQAK